VLVGASSTFGGKLILSPNGLTYSVTGGSAVNVVPQREIWNRYAELYEFYMVESIQLIYHPVIQRVETTLTGIQDTAILPTCAGHLPDTSPPVISFFNPAINLITLQNQFSNLLARKTGKLHDG
jgi:hypothetical protein